MHSLDGENYPLFTSAPARIEGGNVSVSEPGSLALLAAGFAGLGLLRRRRSDDRKGRRVAV